MKTYLIVTQLLYLICVAPWLIIWGSSFMAFDSGFSPLAVAVVIGIGLYPLAVIGCSIVAWLLRMRRKRTAVAINLIPMVWILGIGGFFTFAG